MPYRGVVALTLWLVATSGGIARVAEARQAAPSLSGAERAALAATVRAVHRSSGTAPTGPVHWQSHVMRASDGSHYVALRAIVREVALPAAPVVVYVRLATRHQDAPPVARERSALLEWLDGERNTPLPMRAGGSMSVPRGEMPVGSLAGSGRDPAGDSITALRLLTMERERAARQREDREADRRAALEGGASPTSLLPFEDFDVAAEMIAAPGGGVELRRSLTAAPGDYDVTIAWAGRAGRGQAPIVHVIGHRLTLPVASPRLALSDIVLADDVQPLSGAYRPDRQNAHPYALGMLEASPAADDVFAVDERLSVLTQVINASGDASGKPDVDVSFVITRQDGNREVPAGVLATQRHNAASLPVDFNVAQGHPLFVAVRAPLARFTRGRYRLAITASDVLSGERTTRDIRFVVAGTPHSLLREAPAPGQAFRREALLTPAMTAILLEGLRPATPSAALTQLFEAAANARFAELLRDSAVEPGERAVAQTLRAFGLYALGDSASTVAVQLQQALAQGAPAAPIHVLLGATHALAGVDSAAIAAWNIARDGRIDDPSIAALLVDGYMRQGDSARATAMARAALDAQPGSAAAARGLAAAHIAAGHYAEALTVLAALPPASSDVESDFLVVHALYGGFVGHSAPGNTPGGLARLREVGTRYVTAAGRHAALVRDWLAVLDGDAASAAPKR